MYPFFKLKTVDKGDNQEPNYKPDYQSQYDVTEILTDHKKFVGFGD
jgi:hypothetical protein